MKFYLPLLLAAVICVGGTPLFAASLSKPAKTPAAVDSSAPMAEFDAAVDDLPLMQGLHAVPEQETVFAEATAGRIAESVATGNVAIDDVYQFYTRTLPQLGWKAIDGRTYRRGGEKLRIDARADGAVTTVRFSIKPE